GLDIFMEWSARSMKHDHDKTVARWRHYKSSPPTKLGAGSIFWRANDADPNWRFNIEYPESFESMESPSAAPEDDDLIGDAPKQGEPKSEEKARGLHYLTFDESADRGLSHSTDPLIEGLIDCGAMSIVYGESNSGKSFYEMDQDFHIAAGLPWAGKAVK